MKHLLLALLLTLPLACTPKLHTPAGAFDLGRYSLAGHAFQVPATAYVELQRPDGTQQVTLQLGRPPLRVGRGACMLTYHRPLATPRAAYRLHRISYNYRIGEDSSRIYNVSYDQALRGTLTQLKGGGYSGTFRGSFSGEGTDMPERTTLEGIFTNVLTIHHVHE